MAKDNTSFLIISYLSPFADGLLPLMFFHIDNLPVFDKVHSIKNHGDEQVISVEKAREAILAECRPLGLEKVDIIEACGRVIGEDVFSLRDIPAHANSAMDGYAVRSADTRGAHALKPV